MSDHIQAKADIIPYTPQYSATVRSWIDSEEAFHDVCKGKDFPPPSEIVDSWQRKEVSAYLLFSGGKPVAYGELWNRPNELAVELAHLIVDPARRSEGFGSRIAYLLYEQGAARADIAKVMVNLYNENSAALGCLLKANFELAGTTTHTQGLRLIRMVR